MGSASQAEGVPWGKVLAAASLLNQQPLQGVRFPISLSQHGLQDTPPVLLAAALKPSSVLPDELQQVSLNCPQVTLLLKKGWGKKPLPPQIGCP